MPSPEQLRSYAEVVITVGLGLEPNDRVLIEIPTALPELAHDLVEVSYQGGAEDVEVVWIDTAVDRARFAHGPVAATKTVSQRSHSKALSFESGVSYLRVLAEDPAGMSGMDPDRIGDFTRANNEVVFAARERQMVGEVPWTVISAPVPDWTTSVFPDVDLEEATERLWSAILRACRIVVAMSHCATEVRAPTSRSDSLTNLSGKVAPSRHRAGRGSVPTFLPKRSTPHLICRR